jgi:hypothetical protein
MMRLTGVLVVGVLAWGAVPVEAQVSGAIIIGGGPLGGIITFGERRPVVRKVVVVERHAPRVIVVERLHPRRHRYHPAWRYRGGHERVIVYYDLRQRVYYDRPYRPGLVALEVVWDGDRYYALDDHDGEGDGLTGDRYEGRARMRW